MFSFFTVVTFLIIRHRFFWLINKEDLLGNKTVLISHRGYKKKYPENTISSIQDAIRVGFKWVEIDLVTTKDNVVICSHNLDLETETNGLGYIHNLKYDSIKVLHTGVNNRSIKRERIPRLKDVFLRFSNDIGYNLEIKTKSVLDLKTIKSTMRLTSQMKIKKYMVSSFNPFVILFLKLFHKNIKTALLLESVKYLWMVNWLHPNFVNIRGDMVGDAIIEHSKRHGYGLIAWTINSNMGLKYCKEKKLDAIITDRNVNS